MSFMRLTSRFVVLTSLLSFTVWGTACSKKTSSKKSSTPVKDTGKTNDPAGTVTSVTGGAAKKTNTEKKTGGN